MTSLTTHRTSWESQMINSKDELPENGQRVFFVYNGDTYYGYRYNDFFYSMIRPQVSDKKATARVERWCYEEQFEFEDRQRYCRRIQNLDFVFGFKSTRIWV
jgi:hypothetical protein